MSSRVCSCSLSRVINTGQDCLSRGAQMVRLYVGGLPADVTAEQLAERFAPFGRVEGADLAAPQADGCAALKDASCRGFGYVELEPKDEAALRRCLSTVSKRRL